MKPQVYFFGTFPNGLKSYPVDYTQHLFPAFLKQARNACQIIFHRKDDLAYYSYIREVREGMYWGVCICIDYIFNDIKTLFDLCDNVYASMVHKGVILKIVNSSVDWAITDFTKEPESLTEYSRMVSDAVEKAGNDAVPLPPIDFSISVNACLNISLEAAAASIANAFSSYSNVYIAKTNAEIERITSFYSIIKAKDEKIKELQYALGQSVGNKKTGEPSKGIWWKSHSLLAGLRYKTKCKKTNLISLKTLVALFICCVLFVVIWRTFLSPSFSVSPAKADFGGEGGCRTFTISTSGFWRISENTMNWAELTRTRNTLSLEVAPNHSPSARTGYFTLKCGPKNIRINISQGRWTTRENKITIEAGKLKKDVIIKQLGNDSSLRNK